MNHIIKTLKLAIVAIMTISCLSSCTKNNEGNGYKFEYTDVSFNTEKEYQIAPETRFNLLKVQLETMLAIATDEAYIISTAEAQITAINYQGINATITLKKESSKIKEWTLEATMWIHIEPDDVEND